MGQLAHPIYFGYMVDFYLSASYPDFFVVVVPDGFYISVDQLLSLTRGGWLD